MRLRFLLCFVFPACAASALLAAGPAPQGVLRVAVLDAGSGQPLPCRLTLVDQQGRLVETGAAPGPGFAVRPGVVYSVTGRAELRPPAGRYTLYAGRGMEYSLASQPVIAGPESRSITLKLRRQVDTAGYVSCDTHIHTLTHSGHGDSSLEERMATIAGEGIELAIATDHNHHTDYRPAQAAAGASGFFTSVTGNEVTTPAGHFNAFPIRPGSPIPPYRSTGWKELLAGIRATPGVRVVVLNHPSNDHGGFIPTDPLRFHSESGESLDGRDWDIDGIEVLTSAAIQSDWMKPFRDWFALLNHGRAVTGIGSSDTHDVDRFILGQGRSYVAAPESSPEEIDVEAAASSIRAGRVLVSMGLFTELWVAGRPAGASASAREEKLKVRIRVQAPSWIQADRVELYLNGEIRHTVPVTPSSRAVKLDTTLLIPRPRHDVWAVAVASGPGIREAYWPGPRPYQPARAGWDPRVVGATNPVRLDVDGSGFTSAAGYAHRLVERHAGRPDELLAELAEYDASVSVQVASLLRIHGRSLPVAAVDRAAPHVRQAMTAYRRLLPPSR